MLLRLYFKVKNEKKWTQLINLPNFALTSCGRLVWTSLYKYHGQSHTSVIERRRTRATITQALCSTPLLDARVLLVDPRLHWDKIGDGGLMKNIPFSCLKKEMKWSLLGRGLSVCLTSSGGSEGDTSVEVIIQFAFKFKKIWLWVFSVRKNHHSVNVCWRKELKELKQILQITFLPIDVNMCFHFTTGLVVRSNTENYYVTIITNYPNTNY